MAISPDTIEEVRRTANVYDVISEYINLEKAGSNYKALCPFHSEKTPSFIVSPQKNIFKCFGCGKSGTALSFLMDYEGISFSEAVIKLAQKYNIPVKYTGSEKNLEHLKGLFSVTEKITKFYKDQLKTSKDVKDYLKKREILSSTADHFDLGYSPENPQLIIEFCKKEGIQPDQLKEVGIASEKEDGTIVDRFRGRLIFPIRDHRGRVVAFGGRSLKENHQPKYINSPETEIYSKGKVLYGFFESRDYLREKKWVIIVEGYLDLISLYQTGIKNVIATLGTAFTEYHGDLLKKFVKKAVLMFDSDKAGKKAAIRASKILLSRNIDVYYAFIEEGKDPDDLAKLGYKAVERTLKKAENFLDFLLKKIKDEKELKKKGEIIDLYLDMVSVIPEKTKQGLLIKKLSEETGLQESYLELKKSTLTYKTEEETKFTDYLSKTEKLILKTLIMKKDELLSRFNRFDKIEGSGNFEILVRAILNNEDLEEEVLEEILQSEEIVDVDAAVYALERKYRAWLKKENELYLSIDSDPDEEFLRNLQEEVKKTILGGSVKK
ncbi:DNA primase [Persephonella sp.]